MSIVLIKFLLLALVITFGIKWLFEKPDRVFWISLMLFFDPGGFFQGLLGNDLIWRIKYYDLFFFLMMIAYLRSRKNDSSSDQIPETRKAKYYLLFISLYFLVITGFIIPSRFGYADFLLFLQKNRQYFYALPLFLFAYHFSIRSIQQFFSYLVWFAIVLLAAWFLTILTPLKLLPVLTWSRYAESTRIAMISYGLIYWVQPLGIVVLILGKRIQIRKRKLLYTAMTFMVLTILITLTRREFMRLFFMLATIPLIVSYVTRSSFLGKFRKYFFSAFLVTAFVFLFFPKYIDYSAQLVTDLYSTLITGSDTQGNEDYRVKGTGDMLIVKKIIADNWLFGIGYNPMDSRNQGDEEVSEDPMSLALDASSEVPIYGAIMRLGLAGLILPAVFFVFMVIILIRIVRFMKTNSMKVRAFPVEFSMLFTLIYFFISMFTIDVYGLFGTFYLPQGFIYICLLLGMLLGLYKRMIVLTSLEKV
jgi:hypothetical protein